MKEGGRGYLILALCFATSLLAASRSARRSAVSCPMRSWVVVARRAAEAECSARLEVIADVISSAWELGSVGVGDRERERWTLRVMRVACGFWEGEVCEVESLADMVDDGKGDLMDLMVLKVEIWGFLGELKLEGRWWNWKMQVDGDERGRMGDDDCDRKC